MEKRGAVLSAILLDRIVPEVDGFRARERLEAAPVLSRIPVIVLTAEFEKFLTH